MPQFLSWQTLKELIPLVWAILLHLLEDPPSKSPQAERYNAQRAYYISKLRSFAPDLEEQSDET